LSVLAAVVNNCHIVMHVHIITVAAATSPPPVVRGSRRQCRQEIHLDYRQHISIRVLLWCRGRQLLVRAGHTAKKWSRSVLYGFYS